MRLGKTSKTTKEITRTERNRRNNIRRITVAAITALIIFIALLVIQSSILNQEEKLDVYQVVKDIPSGTKLDDSNINEYLAYKNVQISLIPENFIQDKAEVLGKFVNRNYKAKDIITTDGLIDTESVYLDDIENPTEVSFSVDGIDVAVAGTIREGDYVNIYGMKRPEKSDSSLIRVDKTYTFKHVYINKAFDASGNRIVVGKDNANCTLFSIVIDEVDMDLFNEMMANCSIRLAKLNYDTDTDYQAFITEATGTDVEQYIENNYEDQSSSDNTQYFWETYNYNEEADKLGLTDNTEEDATDEEEIAGEDGTEDTASEDTTTDTEESTTVTGSDDDISVEQE